MPKVSHFPANVLPSHESELGKKGDPLGGRCLGMALLLSTASCSARSSGVSPDDFFSLSWLLMFIRLQLPSFAPLQVLYSENLLSETSTLLPVCPWPGLSPSLGLVLIRVVLGSCLVSLRVIHCTLAFRPSGMEAGDSGVFFLC